MSFNKSLEEQVESVKERIRNMPYEDLQDHVYICFANGCLLLTSFLHKKGESGWSKNLTDEQNNPILTDKEQETIEALFSSAPWIWEMLAAVKPQPQEQEGGSDLPSFTTATSFVKSFLPDQLTGDDVSLDRMFQAYLKKSNELDDFWSKFARESPGFSRMLNQDIMIDTEIQGFPIKLPVNTKPIVYFLITLIDVFRFSTSLVGFSNHLLTIIVLIEELITGQWRQMIMTSAGFISPSGVAIGVLFKYMINVWMLINPSLRDQILKDAYKGTKSIFIGFLLWCASTLPPMIVKAPVEMAISKLRDMAKGMEDKLKALEDKANKLLLPQGKKIVFSEADFSQISKISLEDIQNLQTFAQWNLMNCSAEFQGIITPLKEFPPTRLLIEMLGIPVTAEDKLAVCRMPEPYPSVVDVVQEKLQPKIVNVKGGFRNKTFRAKGKISKRKTRRVKVNKVIYVET